ncbi:MAG: hypothetical protein CDV28_12831 [Candidatus Electronema aureum]|uniref:Uncharacterized protein n=1 Tax=Candidatus Electronema aureum TaxID=2005002 RepID=A0A521G0J9_9BACT|nr:MAG: hypothetical protein CDV28_12831 [Candidatus Electronema aureum]
MGFFNILSKIFNAGKKNNTVSSSIEEQKNAKEKGDAFENYVISKFDRNFFRLKDMRSDKGIKGFYPESNNYPDLVRVIQTIVFSVRG